MSIVLANSSYVRHMTNEGQQLQESLRMAGWTLVGPHYAESERNVRTILSRHPGEPVFVQDKRDWDPASGCPGVTPDLSFHYLSALQTHNGPVSVVVKDAGPEGSDYHRIFCEETGAGAIVIYYHPLSVLKFCPWASPYRLVRTYHTVEILEVPAFVSGTQRRDLCGSGAMLSDVYPLRNRIAPQSGSLGMVWLPHPGYENLSGPDTPRYLTFLSQFKVHFATASAYGFSLRKIIESVACGCTVVTDLPEYDVLPEIDRALIRVPSDISASDLQGVFHDAIHLWDEEGRRRWAEKAVAYYNVRSMGVRLGKALQQV